MAIRCWDPRPTAEQRESVSTAILLLMEHLAPNERAVYVLKEDGS
jgi:RNA polymerase sigma-70 factor (ECF subfamily)